MAKVLVVNSNSSAAATGQIESGIMPGRFNPWGSIVAVYFLVTGTIGFQLLGVETFVQQVFYGVALVVAVALSQIARRRREGIEDEVSLE